MIPGNVLAPADTRACVALHRRKCSKESNKGLINEINALVFKIKFVYSHGAFNRVNVTGALIMPVPVLVLVDGLISRYIHIHFRQQIV